MEALTLIIPIGVILSLVFFLAFEQRAIKANKQAAIVTGEIPMYDIEDKLKQYDTMNNTGLFAVVAYITTLVIAILSYDPSYGLIHALVYIFATTFIGSLVIFAMKFKMSLLVKVFASFLYGAAHIIGSTLAFITSYLIV